VNTLTATDINSGWTEQSAVMGKSQEHTNIGIDNARARFPFPWSILKVVRTHFAAAGGEDLAKNSACPSESASWRRRREPKS